MQEHSATEVGDTIGQTAWPVEIAEMYFSSDNRDVGGGVGDGSVQVAKLHGNVLGSWLIENEEAWKMREKAAKQNIPAWKHLITSCGANFVITASASDSLSEASLPR